MRHKLLPVILAVSCATLSSVQALELSIYSTAAPGALSADFYRATASAPIGNDSLPGYAFVLEQRELSLKTGLNEIRYANIPAFIDPTTLQFRSLTDPNGTEILQQEYRFDLANNQVLLNSYLGKEITVEQNNNGNMVAITGTLLNVLNGLTLQSKDNQIITINNYSAIRFPNSNLNAKTQVKTPINTPTLLWNISAKKAGVHNTEILYQTQQITWWADYNAIFEAADNPNQGTLELNSWVSVMNKTGMDFENAKLKLMAGDVNTAATNFRVRSSNMLAAKMADAMPPQGFSETALFDYHVYSLNNPVNLSNNTTHQIPFLPKLKKIPVEKQYIYNSTAGMLYAGYNNLEKDIYNNATSKVGVYLQWVNNEKSGLGIPLPAGRIRISALTKQTEPRKSTVAEFIGEDIIEHTTKDEAIQVKMGTAFDIVPTKKQTNFSVDNNRHIMEESFEITLKNHKDHEVKILVKENLYRTATWEILAGATPYQKLNSGTVNFPVTVPQNGETTINYTVRYTW